MKTKDILSQFALHPKLAYTAPLTDGDRPWDKCIAGMQLIEKLANHILIYFCIISWTNSLSEQC